MTTAQKTYTPDAGMAWFAARTRFGQEIGVRDRLLAIGVEHYIPTEQKRNYRGKMQEHPVINNLVFIHASRQTACELKTVRSLPVNYIFDYARHTMLTVPDKQMEDFRRVLEASITEGGLMDQPIALGERVRVTRGPLKDVEGRVLELQGKYYVVVGLFGVVFAKAKIPRAWLARTAEGDNKIIKG